jgi:hypothetical protein
MSDMFLFGLAEYCVPFGGNAGRNVSSRKLIPLKAL